MKSKQIYLIYHSCNWLQLSRSKLSQFYCKMKQVGLCFQRRWSFTLMMRIYWHGTSPNIHPVMTVTERNHAPVRASPFIFFFYYLCISHGYDGAFAAVKLSFDLKTVKNWPGRLTSCGWMDIPITKISSVLSVDLLSSQECSASAEMSHGRGR